jgi:steroid delta-isomerase-like uncharacterized protein
MANRNEKLLDRLAEAWCTHDVPALLALYTDDCVYQDMAMGVEKRGKEQLREFATEVFTTMPNFQVRFPERVATEDRGASKWVITATWNGLFEGVDCTGKGIVFTGLSLYEFRDGKLVSNCDCWDYTVMMREFGVLRASLRGLR